MATVGTPPGGPGQPGAPNAPAQQRAVPTEEAMLGKAMDLALLRRLWPFVRPHAKLLLAWACFMPLTILLDLGQPLLFWYALTHHMLATPTHVEMLPYDALAYMLLVVGQGASSFCETWFVQLTGQRTMHSLRTTIFDHVLAQRAAFFDTIPVGRLMTRMTNDIESLNEIFAQGAITLVADLLKAFAIVCVLLAIDVRLTGITFLTLPLLVILVEYARRLMRESFRQIRVRLAAMNAFAQEHLSGIKVVQLLGRAATAQREYNDINAGHRDAYLPQIRADASMYALVEAIGTISIAVAIAYAAGFRTSTVAMLGVVVVFIEYIKKFFAPLPDLSAKYAVMQGAMAASERIFQLLDTKEWDGKEAAVDPAVTRQGSDATLGGASAIAVELAGVTFSYGAEPVLRGIDLRVPRGQTVAIVGATGSGKSTVIKLLTRLYERDSGSVRLGGVEIRDLPLATLRERITVVSQDVILFAGTLAENIALGKQYTEAQLDSAVRRVGLDRALARRGTGSTALTVEVTERGSNFSAGERQLVAFARALLRDPEVLILDEATAHVDPEAEALIERGVAELMKGRTTLVIAHRLSTVRNADRICVIDKGRIVETGDHSTLVRARGLYARLAKSQDLEAGAEEAETAA